MEKLIPYSHPIEVRFVDLDGLGHINNAVYHSYIEQCRTYWLLRSGLLKDHSLNQPLPIILARTEIDYLQQGHLSDKIVVRGGVIKVGRKSFSMRYEVESLERGLLAKAVAVLVWFDFEQHQSVPLPDKVRRLFEECLWVAG